MKHKELKPIVTKDIWSLALQKEIAAIFDELITKDIKAILETVVENAKDSPLAAAIKSGKIKYGGGIFRGAFSSKTSKELRDYGAIWDQKEKGFRLSMASLPRDLFNLIERSERATRQLVSRLKDKIESIPVKLKEFVAGLDFGKRAANLEIQVTDRFRESVTKKIGVQPKLDKTSQEKLRLEYNQDVTKSIVKFTRDETETLRNIVDKAVREGIARGDLRKKLTDRFGISKERAKFIARQETSLFTSKLKEVQYTNAGIKKYRWKTIMDSRARQEHKDVNGDVFFWDNDLNKTQPVNDNGDKVRPGEDFNCRCQAVPLVEVIE